jgi:hypothetical protein
MRFLGRHVWLLVVLLVLAVVAADVEAGGGRGGGGGGNMSGGGHGGGGHAGSHHGTAHGHHGGRIVVGVGPWWGWWGGWPGWYYPPAYYPYYPYYPYDPYYAPPAIVTEPPVYIQRELEVQPAPQAYWYYCESAAGYYPTVQSCPEPWLKVPPRDR